MKAIKSSLISKTFNIIVALALMIGIAVSMAPTSASAAATLVVTNTNDSGPGSLRQAVANAAPGDVITFDLAAYPATIELTTGQIAIGKDLTIVGPGGALLWVSGYMTDDISKHDRVFDVGTGATVTIQGLAIVNGYETNDFGGGIRNAGNLTLVEVGVIGNRSCVFGGGIFTSTTGKTYIQGSYFAYNGVNVDLANCFAEYGGSGGAIANHGYMSINNTEVYSNTALALGGGIYTHRFSGHTEVNNSWVHENLAIGFYGDLGNFVWAYGGGVYNGGYTKLDGATIEKNKVGGLLGVGGGISSEYYGNMDIVASKIIGNEVNGAGGGIAIENCDYGSCLPSADTGIINITTTTIDGNYAHRPDQSVFTGGGTGGGIDNDGGVVTITKSTISNNIADGFGAGIVNDYRFMSITNSTISGNVSNDIGGGIYVATDVTFLNVTMVNNTAANVGGGLFLENDGEAIAPSVWLKNTILALNLAPASPDCFTNIDRQLSSDSNNLIGDTTGCAIVGNPGNDLYGVDPVLTVLKDNGGLTLTHAPLSGSPVLDAGTNDGCPVDDQRGQERPVDGDFDGVAVCDIGSVEGNPHDATNMNPFANPQWLVTMEDTPLPIVLTGADPEDDYPLAFSIVTPPMHGTLSTLTDVPPKASNVVYTPNPDYFGPDQFTFMVTDTRGGWDTAIIYINVLEVPDAPRVVTGLPAAITIDEGTVLHFPASFVDPDPDETYTVVWNFGDGSAPQTWSITGVCTYPWSPACLLPYDVAVDHKYLDNGVYTAVLTVYDSRGMMGSASTVVTVLNVAPVVTAWITETPPLYDGTPVTFNGSFWDPGLLDTHTIVWDFGDGTVVNGTAVCDGVGNNCTVTPVPHLFPGPGDYVVTLTVTDKDGGVGVATLHITIVPLTDLAVSKAASDNPALTGATLVYTLTATNNGPSNATGVVVTDQLSPDVTFVSATAPCVEAAGVVTCNLGNMAKFTSQTLEITVTIDLDADSVVTNISQITGNETDLNLANNMSSLSISVLPVYCVYENDFETTAGTEWSIQKVSHTPTGNRGFLGELNRDVQRLSLSDLPWHTKVQVFFDLFVIRSWDGNQIETTWNFYKLFPLAPDYMVGPDHFNMTINGHPILDTTLSNMLDYAEKQAWPGTRPDMEFDAFTGASEVNTLGYKFNGKAMDSVYNWGFLALHAGDTLPVDFSAYELQPINDESWGLDNVQVCLSSGADLWPRKLYFPVLVKNTTVAP